MAGARGTHVTFFVSLSLSLSLKSPTPWERSRDVGERRPPCPSASRGRAHHPPGSGHVLDSAASAAPGGCALLHLLLRQSNVSGENWVVRGVRGHRGHRAAHAAAVHPGQEPASRRPVQGARAPARMGACSAEKAPHPHRHTEETWRCDLATAPRSCRDEGALCKQARRVHATPGKHRGLRPPTTAQQHEETRVRREAVKD